MDAKLDEAINQKFEELAASHNCNKHFYSVIAGTKHPNTDGSSRPKIIAGCRIGERVELVSEPDNPYDPNAIAVRRVGTNEQLGYVEARLASEMTRDIGRYGPCWVALFAHVNRSPETERVVGGTLYVMRIPAEELSSDDAN